MSIRRAAAVALILGILSTLLAAWLLPYAAIRAAGKSWDIFGWNAAVTQPDVFWADTRSEWPVPRAGHYLLKRHALLTTVDMRRVIFIGPLEGLPYFRQNPPPPWATAISTDQREGFEQVVTVASGWPRRCFRGELWIRWRPQPAVPVILMPGTPPPPALSPEVPRGLLRVPAGAYVGIPLRPMWGGLLVDVALFWVVWLAVLTATGAVRRTIRRRRGRCPCCNYDLRATPPGSPCPECGRGH